MADFDPKVADLFEATIRGKFAALSLLEENVHNLRESIHGAEHSSTPCLNFDFGLYSSLI